MCEYSLLSCNSNIKLCKVDGVCSCLQYGSPINGLINKAKMKTKLIALILFFFLGLLSILGVALFSLRPNSREDPTSPPYPPSQNFELITIQELKERNPDSGFFDVEGYVAKIFSCPPCPAGAECMPCMPENIVISEQLKTIEAYPSITSSEMLVFVQNPQQLFTLGEHYRFSIRVRDFRTTDEPLNDVELVGYSR